MTAFFHMCRGRTSSCSRATSPLLNLVDVCCFRTSWKLLNVVKYCLCHSLQKSSACFCRVLNSFVRLPFVSGSGPDRIVVSLSPMRKCTGVNAPASSSACTMDLELMEGFIATSVVFSPSSETWNRPSIQFRGPDHLLPPYSPSSCPRGEERPNNVVMSVELVSLGCK